MPLGDWHQHLFSPAAAKLAPGLHPVAARDLVNLLDAAGIRYALVLSVAYQLANPNKPALANEYEHVKAENDWTSEQVSEFPERLRAFCGVNPLKEYAIEEIHRCAGDRQLHFGLKLHFGNSDVDLDDPQQVEQIRRVFRSANEERMAIVVHLHPSVTKKRPYGKREARIFLERVLPAAPDVPVQIAHLAGSGGYDDRTVDRALSVFVKAIKRGDGRMAHVYFDASGVCGYGDWKERAAQIAMRIRQLGVKRVLYGSDADPKMPPREAWAEFRKLPLSEAEFHEIARNIPPYMNKSRGNGGSLVSRDSARSRWP